MNPARQVTDAADALAAWAPSDAAEQFAVVRDLPEAIAALAEALGSVAATVHEEPVLRMCDEITDAVAIAAAELNFTAAGLGEAFAKYRFLRSDAPRWLPPGSAA